MLAVHEAKISLVDLLYCRACTTTCIAWHATTRHAAFRHPASTSRLIHLHHNGIHDPLNLFLLHLEFVFLCELVFVEPIKCILDGGLKFLFVPPSNLSFSFSSCKVLRIVEQ